MIILSVRPSEDVRHGELALLAGDLAVKHDLEEQVAQLFDEVVASSLRRWPSGLRRLPRGGTAAAMSRVCSRSHGQPPSLLRRAMSESNESKRSASGVRHGWSRGLRPTHYTQGTGSLVRPLRDHATLRTASVTAERRTTSPSPEEHDDGGRVREIQGHRPERPCPEETTRGRRAERALSDGAASLAGPSPT